ncbi:hypothetical protein [Haladaptatus sp. DJG-WS-42]|uniref:hypothetical protein n=1 Tax=Haladaptatus sp. DJG-WS-42 TaxID=3120516 RepID=UPI0030D5F30C
MLPMGHIELNSSLLNRTIPVDGLKGVITVDLSGDEPCVILPPHVSVERKDASLIDE